MIDGFIWWKNNPRSQSWERPWTDKKIMDAGEKIPRGQILAQFFNLDFRLYWINSFVIWQLLQCHKLRQNCSLRCRIIYTLEQTKLLGFLTYSKTHWHIFSILFSTKKFKILKKKLWTIERIFSFLNEFWLVEWT